MTFGSLESVEGLPCTSTQLPQSLPTASEIPLCAVLLGWAARPVIRAQRYPVGEPDRIEGQPLQLQAEHVDLLATHFPSNVELVLAGWFAPFNADSLRRLAPYRGTLVISPEALEGGKMTEAHAMAIASMEAESVRFDWPCDDHPVFPGMTKDVASLLLPFRGRISADPSLIMFGREGFEVLEQHWSVNADGRRAGRVLISSTAICRLCGLEHQLARDESLSSDSDEFWRPPDPPIGILRRPTAGEPRSCRPQ